MIALGSPNDIARALMAYLDACSHAGEPFEWRDRNCCHFAAGWVRQMTGRDVLAGLPATPDARAALCLVRRLGGGLAEAWTRQLGVDPVLPLFARVGDVVLLPAAPEIGGLGAAVGVCAGRTVVCIDALGNCQHVPLAHALRCWHLGDVPRQDVAMQVAA